MKREDVKVGQVVRVGNEYPATFVPPSFPLRGKIGTVVDISPPTRVRATNVGVQFDGLHTGHDANNHVTVPRSGWYVEAEYLEPITISAVETVSLLPSDAKERKETPLASGVLDYFPSALIEVAKVSFEGNKQHNPGQPLHWARGKSTDQADTLLRHFVERGKLDSDGVRHSAKMCWRALALLQLELESEGAPIARGAK